MQVQSAIEHKLARDGNEAFRSYVARLRSTHGDKFDANGLAPRFAEHYGHRVEVKFSCGTVKRGWISGTTGWRPSLMLMLRRNSSGSSWLVGDKDELIRVRDYGPRIGGCYGQMHG